MDNTPKISFIPKSSLARDESFLERPRPRSLFGYLATFVFLVSVILYVGLYFYNDILAGRIDDLASQIQNIQKGFEKPEIAQARSFRARADLAKKLLNEHTIVTPVFDFLSTNTIENVFYNDLKFARGEKGELSLEVSGEAPSYSSLAYQMDVFRQKDEDLIDFSADNIMLTSMGSVSFVLHVTLAPRLLSYTASFGREVDATTDVPSEMVADAPLDDSTNASSHPETQCETPLVAKTLEDGSVVCEQADVAPSAKSSWLASFWSRFKFW